MTEDLAWYTASMHVIWVQCNNRKRKKPDMNSFGSINNYSNYSLSGIINNKVWNNWLAEDNARFDRVERVWRETLAFIRRQKLNSDSHRVCPRMARFHGLGDCEGPFMQEGRILGNQ